MQDFIIRKYIKQRESLISEIYDKQKMAKMIQTFENVQDLDFKCVSWMNVNIKF